MSDYKGLYVGTMSAGLCCFVSRNRLELCIQSRFLVYPCLHLVRPTEENHLLHDDRHCEAYNALS